MSNVRALVLCLIVAYTIPLRADPGTDRIPRSPHPTAVSVSAEYRRYYDRARAIPPNAARNLEISVGTTPVQPVAGIVSHHLLAAPFIHDWFSTLAAARDVSRFIVVAPRHFAQGTGAIVTSLRAWDAGGSLVSVDRRGVHRFVSTGAAIIDDESFYREHGIGTLVPFVSEYFPDAEIIPIIVQPSLAHTDDRLQRLVGAIKRIRESDSGVFVLISCDFSHHRDPEATAVADRINARILSNLTPSTARRAYADNVPGLIVLAHLTESTRVTIRANSDSWMIWGRDRHDTTSYFFAFLEEASR